MNASMSLSGANSSNGSSVEPTNRVLFERVNELAETTEDELLKVACENLSTAATELGA